MFKACRDDERCTHKGECVVILDPARFDCPKCFKLMEALPADHGDPYWDDIEGLGFELERSDVKVCHNCQRMWIIDRKPHNGSPRLHK